MTGPRDAAARRGLFGERDFRWRGGEVSRIEGFSDAVFAFAVTLLVVALEVPRDFNELLANMASFVVFGVCFVGSSRVDLQACKLEYSIVSPK